VAEGNYSRIGKARVVFRNGNPVGVERLGVAFEPEESWERNARTAGTEDPRITFLDELGLYLLAYSAYGPLGPRIALASSPDLERWERLGPVSFAYEPHLRADLNLYPNKDAVLFPERVRAPNGAPAFAMLHRPMWDLSWLGVRAEPSLPAGLEDERPGIWVSFAGAEAIVRDVRALTRWDQHRLVALPEYGWEALRIGAGTAPLRTGDGWLVLHHGVSGRLVPGEDLQPAVNYAAGAMLLDLDDVSRVVARSTIPLLEPKTDEEREGIVPNVVFPTAVDPRPDGTADVYYGMADSRIGAARLRRVAS